MDVTHLSSKESKNDSKCFFMELKNSKGKTFSVWFKLMGGDVEVITGGGEERQCTIYGAPDNSSTSSSCLHFTYICGLWVLLLSQLYSLWVLFFKDVYSLTTVQFRCSRVDSQTLEGKSPLHWMADLPHHPFSAVTLIKTALRCLPLLFSNSSSSAPTPAVILLAFFKLAGNIFYVWYRLATHSTQALFDNETSETLIWYKVGLCKYVSSVNSSGRSIRTSSHFA